MRKAFGTLIWVAVIGGSALMGACGDDDGGASDTNGGDANGGDAAGGEPASAGGGGKAGSSPTDAGAGGAAQAGGKADGGAAQAGESSGGAGAIAGVGGGGEGGADPVVGGGGAGGDSGTTPTLTYACTANTINHKICSAFSAAACPEEFDCATCVADRKGERELFSDCSTCAAEFDKFFQCGIDAFEGGNLGSGVECVEDYGPDMTLDCYAAFDSAADCSVYAFEFSCPETWPPN